MGWLGVLGLFGLVIHALVRRDHWRAALLGVLGFVIPQAAGGICNGWFPAMLRHQLFAMAMLMLPAGWLLGLLAARPGASRVRRIAPYLVAPALGIASRPAIRSMLV